MAEHTPGPWPRPRFCPDELGFSGWWELGHIASCNREADACLIAAAPTMLEALREVVKENGTAYQDRAVEKARVAIALATGQRNGD